MSADYMTGLGNIFESEAIPGALPIGQNSPQVPPFDLYAEQVSGSAFTMPRALNRHSWLYRIQPSVCHGGFKAMPASLLQTLYDQHTSAEPNPVRWNPLSIPKSDTDFIAGMMTLLVSGDPQTQTGCAVHLYSMNISMEDRYLSSADGEFLIVPESGALKIMTEMGILNIKPGMIAVIPRGILFQVMTVDGPARGYVLENFGLPFAAPELGPIGANGLANLRDFEHPRAFFEDKKIQGTWVHKYGGTLWTSPLTHSPLNVVAWHGNHVPYQYDLNRFNTINTVSFDHPDPSIFTVLSAPSMHHGVSNVDFVIFPERWMVAEHTFRPPYYHRNVMSEYMGLIQGQYDAKDEGFIPGGGSLHNALTPHGPDQRSYTIGKSTKLQVKKHTDTLAFMFESRTPFRLTPSAKTKGFLQQDYLSCWSGLKRAAL